MTARVPVESLAPEALAGRRGDAPRRLSSRSPGRSRRRSSSSALLALLGGPADLAAAAPEEVEAVDEDEAPEARATPLERALQLAREASLDGDSPERRKAFERVAAGARRPGPRRPRRPRAGARVVVRVGDPGRGRGARRIGARRDERRARDRAYRRHGLPTSAVRELGRAGMDALFRAALVAGRARAGRRGLASAGASAHAADELLRHRRRRRRRARPLDERRAAEVPAIQRVLALAGGVVGPRRPRRLLRRRLRDVPLRDAARRAPPLLPFFEPPPSRAWWQFGGGRADPRFEPPRAFGSRARGRRRSAAARGSRTGSPRPGGDRAGRRRSRRSCSSATSTTPRSTPRRSRRSSIRYEAAGIDLRVVPLPPSARIATSSSASSARRRSWNDELLRNSRIEERQTLVASFPVGLPPRLRRCSSSSRSTSTSAPASRGGAREREDDRPVVVAVVASRGARRPRGSAGADVVRLEQRARPRRRAFGTVAGREGCGRPTRSCRPESSRRLLEVDDDLAYRARPCRRSGCRAAPAGRALRPARRARRRRPAAGQALRSSRRHARAASGRPSLRRCGGASALGEARLGHDSTPPIRTGCDALPAGGRLGAGNPDAQFDLELALRLLARSWSRDVGRGGERASTPVSGAGQPGTSGTRLLKRMPDSRLVPLTVGHRGRTARLRWHRCVCSSPSAALGVVGAVLGLEPPPPARSATDVAASRRSELLVGLAAGAAGLSRRCGHRRAHRRRRRSSSWTSRGRCWPAGALARRLDARDVAKRFRAAPARGAGRRLVAHRSAAAAPVPDGRARPRSRRRIDRDRDRGPASGAAPARDGLRPSADLGRASFFAATARRRVGSSSPTARSIPSTSGELRALLAHGRVSLYFVHLWGAEVVLGEHGGRDSLPAGRGEQPLRAPSRRRRHGGASCSNQGRVTGAREACAEARLRRSLRVTLVSGSRRSRCRRSSRWSCCCTAVTSGSHATQHQANPLGSLLP